MKGFKELRNDVGAIGTVLLSNLSTSTVISLLAADITSTSYTCHYAIFTYFTGLPMETLTNKIESN